MGHYLYIVLLVISFYTICSARLNFQKIGRLERPISRFGASGNSRNSAKLYHDHGVFSANQAKGPRHHHHFPKSYHVHHPNSKIAPTFPPPAPKSPKIYPKNPKLIYEMKPKPELVHFEWRPQELELFCQKVPVVPVTNVCPSYLDAARHVFATPCSDDVKTQLCNGDPKKCRLFIRLGIGSGDRRYCQWSISHLWSATNQTGPNAKFGGKYPMETDLTNRQATNKDLSMCLALYHDTTQLPTQLMPMYETVVQQTRKLRLASLNVKTLLNEHEDHFKKNEYIKYWVTTGPKLAADPEDTGPEMFCDHIYIKLGALFKVSTKY